MSSEELNRRLAVAMGWTADDTGWYGDPGMQMPDGRWMKDGQVVASMYGLNPFNPAGSRDHFAKYVLPELERRGVFFAFIRIALCDAPPETCAAADKAVPVVDGVLWPTRIAKMLLSEPSDLALAALEVLEAKP